MSPIRIGMTGCEPRAGWAGSARSSPGPKSHPVELSRMSGGWVGGIAATQGSSVCRNAGPLSVGAQHGLVMSRWRGTSAIVSGLRGVSAQSTSKVAAPSASGVAQSTGEVVAPAAGEGAAPPVGVVAARSTSKIAAPWTNRVAAPSVGGVATRLTNEVVARRTSSWLLHERRARSQLRERVGVQLYQWAG